MPVQSTPEGVALLQGPSFSRRCAALGSRHRSEGPLRARAAPGSYYSMHAKLNAFTPRMMWGIASCSMHAKMKTVNSMHEVGYS